LIMLAHFLNLNPRRYHEVVFVNLIWPTLML
jgi:hypothetical protein